MEKREKIKQIYQKLDIIVDDEIIDGILKNEETVKGLMRIYKDEEIDSMNYIFGKPHDNKYFTEEELNFISKIDLFDRKVIRVFKIIWANKDNTEKLKGFQKILNMEVRV